MYMNVCMHVYLLSYYVNDDKDVCTTLHHHDHHHNNHHHHQHHNHIIIIFIYIGESVSIWDDTRSSPLHSYKWGADSVLSVKFNPAESSLLASTGIVKKSRKNNYNNDDIHSCIFLSTHSSFVSSFIHSFILFLFIYSSIHLHRLGSDRSICLYDLRASVPMRKFLLPMNSNKVTNICRW